MKVPTFNSKADWRFNAQFLQTDPITRIETPIDLTGSRLRVTFVAPDGTLAGQATTEAGVTVPSARQGRVAISIPAGGLTDHLEPLLTR